MGVLVTAYDMLIYQFGCGARVSVVALLFSRYMGELKSLIA
jgi:hypothetical protein